MWPSVTFSQPPTRTVLKLTLSRTPTLVTPKLEPVLLCAPVRKALERYWLFYLRSPNLLKKKPRIKLKASLIHDSNDQWGKLFNDNNFISSTFWSKRTVVSLNTDRHLKILKQVPNIQPRRQSTSYLHVR